MARHDPRPGSLRALSQDNTAGVQKLNEELRKLKEGSHHEAFQKTTTKGSGGHTPLKP
jgi:hypothetical protein